MLGECRNNAVKMQDTPQISIVTPTYNARAWFEKTIDTVSAQTFTDWEWIVVDDASVDATPDLIRRLAARDTRVRPVFSKENQGAGATRNIGVAKVRTRYLAFLDCDDLWEANKLEHQLNFMRERGYAVTYTCCRKINPKGEALGRNNGEISVPNKVAYIDVLKHCCISTSAVMLDRNQLQEIRMPKLSHGEDHVLWLSLLKQTPYAYCLPMTLVCIVIRPSSLSANKLRKAYKQWGVYRHALGFPPYKALWYWLHYVYHGVVKYRRPRA